MITKKFLYPLTIALTLSQTFLTVTETFAINQPVLSLKVNGISSYEALPGEIVTLTYEVDGCDDGWASSGIHFNYDSRLKTTIFSDGYSTLEFKRGEASKYIDSINAFYRSGVEIHSSENSEATSSISEFVSTEQDCVFVYTASSYDSGQNGVILSAEFIVPEDAKSSDVYKFEFWQFFSDLFTSNEDLSTQDFVFENWQNCEITIAGNSDDATLLGDANCDGKVAVADVVSVGAYISNAEKNTLSEQGIINADVHSVGNGLNGSDALMIQQYATGIITTF